MNRRHGRGRFVDVKLPKEKHLQRKVIKRIWSYLRKYPLQLVVVMVSILLQSGINLALPVAIKIAIDDYINIDVVNIQAILLIFASVVIATIVMAISAYANRVIMGLVASRVTKDIRKDAYNKLQELPIKYYDQNPHGDIMSVLTNDIETINQAFYQVIPQIISSLVMFLGAIILMFFTQVYLTLVALSILPVAFFIIIFITKRAFTHFRVTQKSLGELNGILEEDISGLKAVKLYNQEVEMISKFEKTNQELTKATYKANVYSGLMMPIIRLLDNLLYGIIVTVGAIFKINGLAITVGEIQSMTNFSRMIIRPISNIAQVFNLLQAAIAGGYRVFKLMDSQDEYSSDSQIDAINIKGKVEFKNVSFAYGKEEVLKDINFIVEPGKTVAIVGPTGSGKTTIINLLTRFYDIEKGNILIDDEDVKEYSKKSIRRQVGIVLQKTFLFDGTILENIKYGKQDASFEEVVEAAKLAQVHDIIDRLPKKYETVIKEGGLNFSHGERQLISIARTILADKKILVLDEATSSVDTRTESNIQKSIEALIKNKTSFIIAHRLQTIRKADIILVLKAGRIIEAGSHDELMQVNGLYAQMHNLQFSTLDNPFDM
ncbi:MAG: ABC transporter ATP-binding protein [Bacilli bacterium]